MKRASAAEIVIEANDGGETFVSPSCPLNQYLLQLQADVTKGKWLKRARS